MSKLISKLLPPILLFVLLISTLPAYSQSHYTISGTIKSSKSGESISGAVISLNGQTEGSTSNTYGYYSISAPAGMYVLRVTALGSEEYTTKVELNANKKIDISLNEMDTKLEDVTVTTTNKGRSIKNTQMGMEHLTVNQIKNIPVLLGERDILKTLQLMPGVKSAGDGGSGFYVRGGGTDQNLILLDEAPVYNASHLLGFFSTFNSDAVKDVTLYKSGMPAQYGGRLSSVVDVKMYEGNNKDFHLSGGVGLISAKINAEGPIQKNKSSFLISARRTYVDAFLKLSKDTTQKNSSLYFYDINTKLNFELGAKDHLYLSGYFGQDHIATSKQFSLDWGNATATLRWNHIFGNKLFVNTSAIFSKYRYKMNVKTTSSDFAVKSDLQDYHIKQDWQWNLNNKNIIKAGFGSIYHEVLPGKLEAKFGANDTVFRKRYGWENAIYVSNDYNASNRLRLTYGLRLTGFSAIAKGNEYNVNTAGKITDTLFYPNWKIMKTYINIEPRIAASFQLNDMSSLKASYVRNTQNVHLVSSASPGIPLDRWLLSNNIVKPEISDQYSIGYYKDFKDRMYQLTTEVYYKSLQNQIDFKDGADILDKDVMETELLYGKGRAYGWEWLLKKNKGKLTGWFSYTLSKSERKINGINDDKWYNARQDRRHDIAIVGIYNYNAKWTFSANWVFYTGDAVSFPSGKYTSDGRTVYYYSERNGYRMPAYHRLDLGATLQLKKTKKYASELTFSLYNAYGRKNPYIITFRDGKDNPNITEAVQTSLFSFIPSVSYNFKF